MALGTAQALHGPARPRSLAGDGHGGSIPRHWVLPVVWTLGTSSGTPGGGALKAEYLSKWHWYCAGGPRKHSGTLISRLRTVT